MQIKHLLPRHNYLLLMGGVLIVTLWLAFQWILQSDLSKTSELSFQYKSMQQSMQQKLQREQTLSHEHTTLLEQITTLRKALSSTSERRSSEQIAPELMMVMDRLSQKHRVKLHSVKPLQKVPLIMWHELPFEVNVVGRYERLFAWMQEAELTLAPMSVRKFSFSAMGEKGDVLMTMIVASYQLEDSKG